MFRFVLVATLVGSVVSQTCQTVGGAGPCLGGNLCPTGLQCLTNLNICCNNNEVIPAGGNNGGNTNPCKDLLTNCATYQPICQANQYCLLLRTLCPVTCGVCTATASGNGGGAGIGGRPACVDKTTDCAKNTNLCNNSLYKDVMTTQCAKTCARC